MTIRTRLVGLTLAGLTGLGSTAHARAPAASSSKGTVIWTVACAGGGFAAGLWAGLTRFDDATESERKVWTTAAVGAAVGALGGYLIGRSRAAATPSGRPRPPAGSTGPPDRFPKRSAPRRFSLEPPIGTDVPIYEMSWRRDIS